jgi:hypothetical protein
MRTAKHRSPRALAGLVFAIWVATPGCHPVREERPITSGKPAAFRALGRLVCVAEELKRLHQAAVQPVHRHVLGFRLPRKGKNAPKYLLILETEQSKALFVDQRFHARDLLLIGRVFPEAPVLEISGWRWLKDGQLHDVYYWCGICAIRGVDPGPCACCQGKVVLREERVKGESTE